uniref:Uncharacterized protein n=1 Tax=Arundo donax TaxID=35708 RepID=A0A0A9EBN1_ARUDO
MWSSVNTHQFFTVILGLKPLTSHVPYSTRALCCELELCTLIFLE